MAIRKEIRLPKWDGVTRAKSPSEHAFDRRKKAARRREMTQEELKEEEHKRGIEIVRKKYWDDPKSVSRQMLSTHPELRVELDDWLRRFGISQREQEAAWRKSRKEALTHRSSLMSELDRFAWRELVHLRRLRREATGIDWHIDHMIPLRGSTASGLHIAANWQLIPSWMNAQKKAKQVLTERDEWIKYINKAHQSYAITCPWLYRDYTIEAAMMDMD